jgi:hypothetical protein
MIHPLLAATLAILLIPVPWPARAAEPPARFAATPAPPAPDYALPAAWAARPSSQPGADAHPVDVFYIHPTTFHGAAWNQDVADAAVNAAMDASVLRTQASAFDACCRVFAPRYRQASSAAFAHMWDDGDLAYGLAYADIARAFETYLLQDNHGRPFILAGHSQGALHVLRLLQERLDGRPEAKRMVAAYVVGIGVSRGVFGRVLKTIPACAKPDQTGCVVTWNTFQEGRDPAGYIAGSEARYVRQFGDGPDKALVCINPLTFDADIPDAGPDRHLGAVPLTPVAAGGRLASPIAHAVSAQCREGVVMISTPGDRVALAPLPNGSLHMQDMELFWGNIQADAQARSRAFLTAAKP